MKNIKSRTSKNKNLHRFRPYEVICGSEEYELDPRRTNPYDGYDYHSVVNLAKKLTDQFNAEAEALRQKTRSITDSRQNCKVGCKENNTGLWCAS